MGTIDYPVTGALYSGARHGRADTKRLSADYGMGVDMKRRTLEATLQDVVMPSKPPLYWRFSTMRDQLR